MSLEKRIDRVAAEVKRLCSSEEEIPRDPVKFLGSYLGFEPTPYQVKLLEDDKQFIAVRWCRQSGKSQTASALLLHFALTHPGVNVAVVAPSFRQSKLIIRRINSFISRNRDKRWVRGKQFKTEVKLSNGSTIEAYPNNPDTIRGPTLHLIYCDEMNFISDDEDLYDAILFTLSTTNGRFIATSTPWSRDHVFYRICNDEDFSDFSRHHITWREAVEPDGPLRKGILEKIRRQLRADPWRWRREMEAEWAEDEDAYFPAVLITRCIDPDLELISEDAFIR